MERLVQVRSYCCSMRICDERSSKATWTTVAVFFSLVVLALTLRPDSTVNTSNYVPLR